MKKDINWNQLRDKVFDLIINKKVFDLYITEDLNAFGFKAKTIEDERYGYFINEFWFTDDEIKEKYAKEFESMNNPIIKDLPAHDYETLVIQIPKEYYLNMQKEFKENIITPLEKKLEENDLRNVFEMGISYWTEQGLLDACKEYGFNGDLDDIMDYAVYSTICPFCNEDKLHEDEVMNPISRKDNKTYICNDCAMNEVAEEMKKYGF